MYQTAYVFPQLNQPHGVVGAHSGSFQTSNGLSLRDYFAAQVMQGMCAHPDNWGLPPERMAKLAYEIANQMLEARRCVKSD